MKKLLLATVATLAFSAGAATVCSATPELLPEVADESIFGPNYDQCPSWSNSAQAKAIIVALTGPIEHMPAINRDIRANTEKALASMPEWQASQVRANVDRKIQENESLTQQRIACRATIARALGMTDAAVQQLYDYNTQKPIYRQMFNDLKEQRDPDFSKLLAMPDRMEALHVIDLELRELNYTIREFTEMVATDTESSARERDQRILARLINFRESLQGLRKSSASAPILLLEPTLKSTSNTRFARQDCGSIIDTSSNLEWYVGPDRDFGWQEASIWVATLQSCGVGWSMPIERQLASLFDITKTAGTGFFTGGRYFPAHFDPAFSQIGGGSWVWLAGRSSDSEAPAYNANQNLAVRYSADGAKYPTRVFAVRAARAPDAR